MSHMSNKAINDRNEVPYNCLKCGTHYYTGYNGIFCSEGCAYAMEETVRILKSGVERLEKANGRLQIEDMILDDLIHDREHEKVNNLRNGKTLPLG